MPAWFGDPHTPTKADDLKRVRDALARTSPTRPERAPTRRRTDRELLAELDALIPFGGPRVVVDALNDIDLALLDVRRAEASRRPPSPEPWYADSRRPQGLSTELWRAHCQWALLDSARHYAERYGLDPATASRLALRRPVAL